MYTTKLTLVNVNKQPELNTHIFKLTAPFLPIINAIHHFYNTFYAVNLQNTDNKKDCRKSKEKTCDACWLQESDRTNVHEFIKMSRTSFQRWHIKVVK